MVRDHIRVRVNGVAHEVRVRPDTTLLEWLRQSRKLTGSKEGCAEGDCGACTVVVAKARNGQVRFRAVNSCIVLMPMLDGASVTTVEGLSELDDGALNDVQSALIEKHGSQCGFCTPGFVMSMFADRMDRLDAPVDEVLAGNLCRCTGYGPIVAAMESARSIPLAEAEVAWRAREAKALRELVDESNFSLVIDGQYGFGAASLPSALAFLGQGGGTVVGGATDVGLWITKQHRTLPRMLFVERVSELGQISTTDDMLRIGGAVTYTEAEDALAALAPAFKELVSRIGGVQVRNSGTIGGNIANGSPIGDMPPCLIALGARVVLQSVEGERVLPLEQFFIAYGKNERRPDELVVRIEIPKPIPGSIARFYKVSKRTDSDITAVLGAFHLVFDGARVREARIAFGGMAGVPARAKRTEAALIGTTFDANSVADAMAALDADFQPISDFRASAGYRRAVGRNLLQRLSAELREADEPTQLNRISAVTRV